MIRTAVFLLLLLHGTVGDADDGGGPKAIEGVEGIWKLCYEPGLPGVYEIDKGYLVLMPEGRYYEVSESCCFDGEGPLSPYWEMDSYTVEDEMVILHHKRFDGTSYKTRLRHVRGVKAVFFDSTQSVQTDVDALMTGENLNNSWCRIYPGKVR